MLSTKDDSAVLSAKDQVAVGGEALMQPVSQQLSHHLMVPQHTLQLDATGAGMLIGKDCHESDRSVPTSRCRCWVCGQHKVLTPGPEEGGAAI